MIKIIIFIFTLSTLYIEKALCGELTVLPEKTTVPPMDFQSMQPTSSLIIKFKHSCHGGNLRNYKGRNKLARFAKITSHLEAIIPPNTEAKKFKLTYPSSIATGKGISTRINLPLDSEFPFTGSKAFLDKHILEIRIPIEESILEKIKDNTEEVEIKLTKITQKINELADCSEKKTKPKKSDYSDDSKYLEDLESYKEYRSYCYVYNNSNTSHEGWYPRSKIQGYLGKNGALMKNTESDSTTKRISIKGNIIDLNYSFLGEDGLCKAYFSPLILFFNDDYPKFSGKSFFLNNQTHGGSTYWVESNSKGYFLFLDKNNNNFVDNSTELFGDETTPNGFEELVKYDVNNDKIIDEKDTIYNKLQLWYDKNGDGISQKNEIMLLSDMGVKSLSLRYNSKTTVGFGDRAEARQKSTFTFKSKSGNLKKGIVLDIYFGNY